MGDHFFSSHVVLVGLQFGALVSHGVNDPQVTGLTLISAHDREALRVMSPGDVGVFTLFAVFFFLYVSFTASSVSVAVVFFAVCRELDFFHFNFLFRLVRLVAILTASRIENLLVGFAGHRVKVMIAGKDNHLAVRGHASPRRVIIGAFPVCKLPNTSSYHVVFEVKYLLLDGFLLIVVAVIFLLLFFFGLVDVGAFFVLGRLDFKLECVLIDKLDASNRQVLSVPGILRESREFGSNTVVIKYQCLGALRRIH